MAEWWENLSYYLPEQMGKRAGRKLFGDIQSFPWPETLSDYLPEQMGKKVGRYLFEDIQSGPTTYEEGADYILRNLRSGGAFLPGGGMAGVLKSKMIRSALTEVAPPLRSPIAKVAPELKTVPSTTVEKSPLNWHMEDQGIYAGTKGLMGHTEFVITRTRRGFDVSEWTPQGAKKIGTAKTLQEAKNMAEPELKTIPSMLPKPGEAIPVLKLKDGSTVYGKRGQQHFEVADTQNIPYENVSERGFLSSQGYTNPGSLTGMQGPGSKFSERKELKTVPSTPKPTYQPGEWVNFTTLEGKTGVGKVRDFDPYTGEVWIFPGDKSLADPITATINLPSKNVTPYKK